MTSTSWHASTPGGLEAFAAGIVLVLTLIAVFWVGPFFRSGSPRGGLFTGYDRRVSTSKTIAFLWTAVVAWMVASEVLVVLVGHPHETITPAHGQVMHVVPGFFAWMHHVLDEATSNPLYLIFLGGPYAAAIMSKVVVTTRVASGTLQKTDGDPNQPGDLIRNDAGAVDLVDFQYVLFNLIVAGAAIGAFIKDVGAGLPSLTDFLAILTGGSALTYTVNKGVTNNQPALTAIHPQSARVGDRVTAYGNNLSAVSSDPNAVPSVTVAGVAATVVEGSATSDQVTFLVPAPPTGTAWYTGEPERVIVTTVAGVTAVLDNQLQVVPDEPFALRLDPAAIDVAGPQDYASIPISMYGQFLGAPGATPGTSGAAQIEIAGTGNTVTVNATLGNQGELIFILPSDFPVPNPGAPMLSLDVSAVRPTNKRAGPLRLTVGLVDAPTVQAPDPVNAPAGSDLSGQTITLTGGNLKDPVSPSGGPAAAKQALPIQVRLADEHDNELARIETQRRSDTQVAFNFPRGMMAPAAGQDDRYHVALVRGVLVSNTVDLVLHGHG